ncbi:integrase catalytic domain-containing protein [Trichonephila clavipes]|nr:integrase catalytic domain-containing protein [Trichonephila clavipes]
MYPIGLSADIEMAFLQISVTPEHRDFLRFFDPHENNEIVYRLCRLVFGVCSSPFLLAASINHLLDNTRSKYMDIVSQLRHSFYADNCVTGVSDTQKIGSFVNKFKEILLLQNIEIPRYCEMNSDSDLHVFVDASKEAYAACIFVRTKLASGIKLDLLRAKARVASTESVSMPRFYGSPSLDKKNGEWLNFVSNRIKEIARISSPENWRHVPGQMKPADVLFRGCSPRQLLESKWFGGPEGLLGNAVTWPTNELQCETKVLDRNAVLTYEELLTVLYVCESIVNSRPLTYVSENSDDLIPLASAMSMMSNASLDVTDLDLSDFARFQKRVKFRARLLKDIRGRFRKEYLGLLVQKAHKTTRALKVGEIVLIENPNKKRLYWPLGKVIELIPGRDRKVRTLKLRCSNSEIIRPIQRVFPLAIQSAEMGESNDVPLDAEALRIPSADVDVSESAIPVNAPPNMPKVSRYGRTLQRPRRLNVFNVTTVFESE